MTIKPSLTGTTEEEFEPFDEPHRAFVYVDEDTNDEYVVFGAGPIDEETVDSLGDISNKIIA